MGNSSATPAEVNEETKVIVKEEDEFSKWQNSFGFNSFYFSDLLSEIKMRVINSDNYIQLDKFEGILHQIFRGEKVDEEHIENLFRTCKENNNINLIKVYIIFLLFSKNKEIVTARNQKISDKAFFIFSLIRTDENEQFVNREKIDDFIKNLIEITINQIIAIYIEDQEKQGKVIEKIFTDMKQNSFRIQEEMMMKCFSLDYDSVSLIDISKKFEENNEFLSFGYIIENGIKIIKK